MNRADANLRQLVSLGDDLRSLVQRAERLAHESESLIGDVRLQRATAARALERMSHRYRDLLGGGARKACVCSWRSALACAYENRVARKKDSEAGIELDKRVAFHLAGERPVKVPPFSTCRSAANRLLRRLDREGLVHVLEKDREDWYCSWTRKSDGSTIATGSGPTPALATCRAVLNLDLGRIRPAVPSGLRTRVSESLRLRALETFRCVQCGREISSSRKPRNGTTCNPCAWREGRDRRAGKQR